MTPDLCFEGWKMKDGNSSGRCCCNCRHQRFATGHPWNDRAWIKRPMTTNVAYACTNPELEKVVLFDKKHGMCEVHEWKQL